MEIVGHFPIQQYLAAVYFVASPYGVSADTLPVAARDLGEFCERLHIQIPSPGVQFLHTLPVPGLQRAVRPLDDALRETKTRIRMTLMVIKERFPLPPGDPAHVALAANIISAANQ